tara:strand:- start:290 stop:556 length:267 start_codon:yes stop_codon:yes gene_type:complete
MRFKCNSSVAQSIIKDLDQQLSKIPSNDVDGTPTEDSMHLDSYIDAITMITAYDISGKKFYPFGRTVATIFVEDEIQERKNQPTGDEK